MYPLGNFKPDAPVDPNALAEARSLLSRLPECPAGTLDHLYLHWSVGHWNQDFDDYNVSVRFDGTNFDLDVTHDPRDNARGVNDDAPAEHTWLRNTGALGICTDAMVGATVENFGPEPVTLGFLEHLCAAAAACAHKYGIDLAAPTPPSAAPYQNEHAIMTHAEAAFTGGNPPPGAWYNYGIGGSVERWDLATFVAVPDGHLTQDMAIAAGDALRARARAYKLALGA